MSWLSSVFKVVIGQADKEQKENKDRLTNVLATAKTISEQAQALGIDPKNTSVINALIKDGTIQEKPTVANTANTSSVYTSSDTLVTQIAKAIGLNVNLGADGKVTGSLSAGTSANPAANAVDNISAAISKYWWILVIVIGAVLIFRPGRR
jgi:hypothetical protein